MSIKNSVELLGYYGSDEVIACSAWTSTNRNLTQEKKDRIPNLIKMLWREGHQTPFEKATIHFLVDCDIASHIHLLKHRIASINAESARYKELKEDKYYLPEDWKGVRQLMYEGKFEDSYKNWYDVLESFTKASNKLYHECLQDLEPVLGRKRAKESARFFKTYNSKIQADVLFNMRSFANFLKLRNSKHAQKEIREIAQDMIRIVEQLENNPFEHMLAAWKEDGLI
jgi:thymidylate synthase (FAD)